MYYACNFIRNTEYEIRQPTKRFAALFLKFIVVYHMILINKPIGPTSHDIVDEIRKITGVSRVGHAGTLDPFASGLLIILVGREQTRLQSDYLGMDKTYEADIRLGATSSTDDRTGTIVESQTGQYIDREKVRTVLQSFVGEQDQLPPAYSAKKIKGLKAYDLARKGITPLLAPKRVTIYSIEILSYEWPLLAVRMTVSSGTYIRAFARDLGARLSCGAYVEKLVRTSIGPYLLSDAQSVNEFAQSLRKF